MRNGFFIEAETISQSKHGEAVCGDACLSKKLKEENRLITVMSDGLGSGIKANIMATMTTSMALQFTLKGEPITRAAEFIMHTLPIDTNRKMSYSTFSIMDINYEGGVNLIEYDNPEILIYRKDHFLNLKKQLKTIDKPNQKTARVFHSSFKLQAEDRIIIISDGITQSGIGTDKMHFGWQINGVKDFIQQQINKTPKLSAKQLAKRIVERAQINDGGKNKDDATCCVLYYRTPRRILIASGPPFHQENDKILTEKIRHFEGKKVICGGTTSKIISRELNLPTEVSLKSHASGIPPKATMRGIDLVTEGILTLGKLSALLESPHPNLSGTTDPATELARIILDSDEIIFISGTRINNAHQDPNLPIELEIRRNVIKKIASLLEETHLKKVEINYL